MAELVLYFSRADENYFGGKYRYITKGNTEVIAEMIAELRGADLFKVEPLTPYAADYATCIQQAKKELKADEYPPIVAFPQNVEHYDTIFVGYPMYWGTMPRPMFTCLSKLDLAGKKLIPFSTHEGSGLGYSERDLKKLCPESNLGIGLAVRGSEVSKAKDTVAKWLQQF